MLITFLVFGIVMRTLSLALLLVTREITVIEIIEPEPEPAFIGYFTTRIEPRYRDTPFAERSLCLTYDQLMLWDVDEADTEPYDITDYLIEHTEITVDESSLSLDMSSNFFGGMKNHYSEEGRLFGVYYDGVLCYSLDAVDFGLHPATLTISNPKGDVFTYSWQLDVR